jgi:hypothetical protein
MFAICAGLTPGSCRVATAAAAAINGVCYKSFVYIEFCLHCPQPHGHALGSLLADLLPCLPVATLRGSLALPQRLHTPHDCFLCPGAAPCGSLLQAVAIYMTLGAGLCHSVPRHHHVVATSSHLRVGLAGRPNAFLCQVCIVPFSRLIPAASWQTLCVVCPPPGVAGCARAPSLCATA